MNAGYNGTVFGALFLAERCVSLALLLATTFSDHTFDGMVGLFSCCLAYSRVSSSW